MASNSQPVHGQGYVQQSTYSPVPQQRKVDMGDTEAKVDGIDWDTENLIRLAFIRKVYKILMVQLVVIFGFVAVYVLCHDLKMWSRHNFWVANVAMGITFILIFVMAYFESVRREASGNFICLGIFSIAEGIMLGDISSKFEADSVLLAFGITAIICLCLTIFAMQTKIDLIRGLGSIFCIILIVFVPFGLLTIFLLKSRLR